MIQEKCHAGGTLWQRALDEISPDIKASLEGIIKDSSVDVVTGVLQEAKEKKALCLKKRWKIEFRGQTIVLRDLFDKIISWANQFKAVIDVAIQFDQTAASLPWAGVRLLLNVAISDKQCFESTVCGLEFVSLLIARYAGLEALYTQNTSQKPAPFIQSELEIGIVRVYRNILLFLADGIRYFGQPTPVRTMKSIFRSGQDDRIDQLTKEDEEVVKLAQVVDSKSLQETSVQVNEIKTLFEKLHLPIQRFVDESAIYAKTLEQENFVKVLQWLSSIPYSQHHKRRSDESLAGLSQWIFRHPQYTTWKGSSSSSILLLHGIPGCGKTHLTTAVVDEFLNEKLSNPLCAPIAYFYCGDSRFGRGWTDPDELMRSLTRQFAIVDKEKLQIHESVCLEYLRREAEAKLDGFDISKLRSAECADLILEILGTNPAVIIVDGVDEICEDRRHEILHALTRIRDDSASVVKVFLSSRDNNNIFAGVPDALKLRVQETNSRQDIEKYVRYSVSNSISSRNLLNGSVPDELEQKLVDFLIEKAGEMFLWVNLQMERFCKLRSTKSVADEIQDPSQKSSTIENLYSEILENLEQTDPVAYETAINTFSWMLCMQEPLSCTAILEAVSSGGPNNNDLNLVELLNICSNLIVLDSHLNTLRFSHVSFKEFLETKPQFDSSTIHRIAALRCLESCINSLPIEIDEPPDPANNYILYAVMYWPNHYVSSIQPQNDLTRKLNEFIFDDEGFAFGLWLEAANEAAGRIPNSHPLKKDLSAVASDSQAPLFTACVYGLLDILHEVTVASDFDIDATNLLGHTGLYLAAACGHDEVVRHMMDLGGDPSISKGKHKDPLLAACANGHFSVVELLVTQKDRPYLLTDLESALRISFPSGNEQLTKFLLNKYLRLSENIAATDNSWILEAAAQTGFIEVMEILAKDLPKSTASKSSSKAISFALRKGNISFIKRYLEKQQLPDDALATAALFGKTEVIKLCLDNGCSIEVENAFGTPLRCASLMGHEAAVRLLLSHGADINAWKSMGDPLQAAAMNGHLSLANLLIQSGSRLDNPGGFFGDALQAAAYRGNCDVTEMLLNAGARIEGWYSKNARYKDAFHAAAESGKDKIIDLLLSRGYKLPGGDRPTIHHSWEICGFKDVLRAASPTRSKPNGEFSKQSEKDGSENIDDKPVTANVANFQEVLAFTTSADVTETDETYCAYRVSQHGSDREDLDSEYYALEVSASRGYLTTVQRILAMREHLGLRLYHSGRALWAASKHGYLDVVQAILSESIDLLPFIKGSLERAARHGHLEVIDILLQHQNLHNTEGELAVEPDSTFVWWYEGDLKEDRASRRHEYPNYAFKSENALSLVFPSCRGDQLSTMLRGFELVDRFEVEDLKKIALLEAIRFNGMSIVDYLLERDIHMTSEFLSQLMETAAANGCTPALKLLLARDHTGELLAREFDECIASAIRGGHDDTVELLIANGTCRNRSILDKGFVDAARMGNIGILNSLSSFVLASNSSHISLAHALNIACWEGKKNAVEWLIHAGADVNSTVDDIPSLETPDISNRFKRYRWMWPRSAVIACLQPLDRQKLRFSMSQEEENGFQRSRPERYLIIGQLVDCGANINVVGACTRTALHIAAEFCSLELVQALMSHGADVNHKSSEYGTPLQCAMRREVTPLPIVHALIEGGATIDYQENDEGRCIVLDEALKHFGSRLINRRRYGFAELESMDQVLSDGPGAVIKWLLVSQIKLRAIDHRFNYLLQMVSARGGIEYVQLLVDRDVDVNACGYYYGCALQAAARFSQYECVKLLLKSGAHVNLIGGEYRTPLQAGIVGGHEGVIRELISRGADVNFSWKSPFEDTVESSPLRLAIQSQNKAIAELLLENGADPRRDPQILHLALDSDNPHTLKMLLDAGADINYQNQFISTPLIKACAVGNREIINLLIERGANIHASRENTDRYDHNCGKIYARYNRASALHSASAGGHYDIVRMLLLRGAKPNHSLGGRATPIAVALSRGFLKIVKLLFEFGAIIYDPPDIPNALAQAVSGERPKETMELLLPYLQDSPVLIPACEEALQEVLKHGSEDILMFLVNKIPRSLRAFAVACRLGSKQAVSVILSHGVDIDSDLGNGDRAIHLAAYHHQKDLVSLLIDKGADASIICSTYGSPLNATLEGLLLIVQSSYAGKYQLLPENEWPRRHCYTLENEDSSNSETGSESGQSGFDAGYEDLRSLLTEEISVCKEIVLTLRGVGADINNAARPLGPPLHVAAYIGETSLVEVLIDQGAPTNINAGHFGSALIASLINGHHVTLNYLLRQGVNANACSERFGTALHYACRYRSARAVQSLLDYGSDPNLSFTGLGSSLTATLIRGIPKSDDPGAFRKKRPKSGFEEVLNVLLEYKEGLEITDTDFILAAQARDHYLSSLDKTVLESLLELHPEQPVTRNLVAAIIPLGGHGGKGLKTLLQRTNEFIITTDVLMSVRESKTLETLFQFQPHCKVSPEVFEALAGVDKEGRNLLEVLLDHDPQATFTPETIVSFLKQCEDFRGLSSRYVELLQNLLDRVPDMEITESMLMAAIWPDQLRLLLSRCKREVLRENVVLGNVFSVPRRLFANEEIQLLEVFCNYFPNFKLGRETFYACLRGHRMDSLEFLFRQDPKFSLPPDLPSVLIDMLRTRDRAPEVERLSELFHRYGKHVSFTEESRKDILEILHRQSKEKFKNLLLTLAAED